MEKPAVKIAMAVSNDLRTDQRVARHRQALAEAGYSVAVLGRDEFPTRHRRGWRFYLELNRSIAREIPRQQPDIVWANDTDTLPGCRAAASRCHAKLVLDCHELFPEVPEIQHKPLVKWVWRTVERWLMPKCDALLTVCDSIAEYYRLRYCVPMTVVRNLPACLDEPKHDRTDSTQSLQQSTPHTLPLLLYQGKVNLGRGVDWAIDAMEWLTDCRLTVAGDGDLLEAMRRYAAGKPWSDRISFTGRLVPEELHRLTPQADVGLVMLEDMGLSYHYALPNRIGDFVQAGVPMVVSDLPEMSTVVKRYRIGEVMREPGAQALAESVKKVLAHGKGSYDFAAARKDMDWNKEKNKLIKTVNELCYTTSY